MNNSDVPNGKTPASARSVRLPPFLCTIAVAAAICGYCAGQFIGQVVRPGELSQARQLARDGILDEAVTAYHKHLDQHPGDHAVRLELALLLQDQDEDAALKELRQIPANAPEHLTAARYVAGISLKLQRDYDAIAPLELLEAKFPNDAGVQQALAEIYFRRRDYDLSLEHAQRFRTLKPDSTDACLLIAEASDGLGRSADMIEPLEAALRIDQSLPQAHLNLAFAYEAAGQPEQALPHVRWFLERYPRSVAAHKILTMVERGRGQYDEALLAAQAGRKLAPRNLDLAILEAEILLYLRRPAEAYDVLNALTDDWPRERRLVTPLLRAAVMCRKTERVRELQSLMQELDAKQ